MGIQNQEKKYKAFISYSHRNNRDEGRKWADWLHHALETYEIPNDLIGKKNKHGQEIPRQIYPVFQDEKELSASSNLNDSLSQALDQSEFLIFLSSPTSAKSKYVQEEIKHFKLTGKSQQIMALILEGEPEYQEPYTDEQCFPDELRYQIAADGSVNYLGTQEVLAADVRIPTSKKQGYTSPEAYRRYLIQEGRNPQEIKADVNQYKTKLDLALLKLIAGILSIPLNELTKRDQAYQLEKIKKKNRNIKRVAIAISLFAVLAVISGIFAWNQRNSALRNLAKSLYASGINKLTESEYGDGAAYIAEATRRGDQSAALFAHSMLAVQENLALMPNINPVHVRFSPNAQWIVSYANAGLNKYVLQIWSSDERKLLKQIDSISSNSPRSPFFDQLNRVYVTGQHHDIVRYDIQNNLISKIKSNTDSTYLTIKAVSQDGKYIAYIQNNGLHVLDIENSQEQKIVDFKGLEAYNLSFSPDSKTAIISITDEETTVKIYKNIDNNFVEKSQLHFKNTVRAPVFNDQGNQVLFNNIDGLSYYNIETGNHWNIPSNPTYYKFYGFLYNGTINAGTEEQFDLINPSNGQLIKSQKIPSNFFYNSNLNKLLSQDALDIDRYSTNYTQEIINDNGQAFIENLAGQALRKAQIYLKNNLSVVVPSSLENQAFVLYKKEPRIHQLDLVSGKITSPFESINEPIVYVQVLKEKNLLLLRGESGKTFFYDIKTAQSIGQPLVTQAKTYIINPEETKILARTSTKSFSVWDINTGKLLSDFVSEDNIDKFTANPDLKSVLIVGPTSWKIVDINTKKVIKEGNSALSSGAYSTTGSYLLIVDAIGNAQVLETKNYKTIIKLKTIEFPFIVYNNEGNVLAISEDANHMKLWDLESGNSFGQTIRISKNSTNFQFTADDQRIIIQDDAETGKFAVKMIDAQSGNVLTMPFINQSFKNFYLLPKEKDILTVQSLLNGYAVHVWEIPGQLPISNTQLAQDLEKFYGKKYDNKTGAIVNHVDFDKEYTSWYFDDPYTRLLTPSSNLTALDQINKQYPIDSEEKLNFLAVSYAYHPLARAILAEHFSKEAATHLLSIALIKATEKQNYKVKDQDLIQQIKTHLNLAKENLKR